MNAEKTYEEGRRDEQLRAIEERLAKIDRNIERKHEAYDRQHKAHDRINTGIVVIIAFIQVWPRIQEFLGG